MERVIASRDATGEPSRAELADQITAEELRELYLTDVYRYILRRVPRREDAEDVASETFAAAFTGLPRFNGRCPPRIWLLSIARRKVADVRRRRSSRRETLASELANSAESMEWDSLSSGDEPERDFLKAEARGVLRNLVSDLSEDQREALFLKYWERLSVQEIATVMGRSPASANSLLQRARAAIRRSGAEYFSRDGDDGDERRRK